MTENERIIMKKMVAILEDMDSKLDDILKRVTRIEETQQVPTKHDS